MHPRRQQSRLVSLDKLLDIIQAEALRKPWYVHSESYRCSVGWWHAKIRSKVFQVAKAICDADDALRVGEVEPLGEVAVVALGVGPLDHLEAALGVGPGARHAGVVLGNAALEGGWFLIVSFMQT